MAQEETYHIKGMHCAACEVLVEKKLLEIPGVKAVDASTAEGRATIEYEGEKPGLGLLNNIFKTDNYTFSDARVEIKTENSNSIMVGLGIALVIITLFLLLDRMGVARILNISSRSSVVAFLGLGVLASLSSCAALVGGIVLSMSKQWQELYNKEHSIYHKLQPHILFNIGRVVSYILLGGVLGLIGSRLQLSFQFTAFLIMVVSLLMIALGLQMLEVPVFRKFQFTLPKFITRYIADEGNFKGRYMPFFMGAATFFLPCGFTIAAQSVALLSGNALQAALIMGFFALGTVPVLLLIGLSSVKLLDKPSLALIFGKTAGFLVVFFALYNIYNQIQIL